MSDVGIFDNYARCLPTGWYQPASGRSVRQPIAPSPSRRSPAFWVFVVGVVLLNIWYDFRHPIGTVFDVVCVLALLILELRKSE